MMNQGKTTITYRLKLGDVVTTIPTIGFNVETIQYKKLQMTMWDIGGQDKIRPLWRHYFVNTAGLIFAVDSNDRYFSFLSSFYLFFFPITLFLSFKLPDKEITSYNLFEILGKWLFAIFRHFRKI